jgi:hypothetical protein
VSALKSLRRRLATARVVSGTRHVGQEKTESFQPPTTQAVDSRCRFTATGKKLIDCSPNQFAAGTLHRFSREGLTDRNA